MQASSERALVRALGVRSLTASIINTTIGAGIFVLPAAVAAGLGHAAPIAYVVCGTLMALIVACFAAAASRVSLTGGLYAYVGVAFGPFVGFLAGVLYQLMAAFAVASVASAFAGSVGALWTPVTSPAGRAVVLIALVAVLAAVNVRGVVFGARLVETVTVAKLLPLLVLVGAGLWYVNPDFVRLPALPVGVGPRGRVASGAGRRASALPHAARGDRHVRGAHRRAGHQQQFHATRDPGQRRGAHAVSRGRVGFVRTAAAGCACRRHAVSTARWAGDSPARRPGHPVAAVERHRPGTGRRSRGCPGRGPVLLRSPGLRSP